MSDAQLRVVFDTAGGRRAGVGHVLRSLALAERVREMGARPALLAPVTAGALSPVVLPVDADDAQVIVVDRPDTTADRLRRHHRRWPAARMVALDYYGVAVEGLAAVVNLNEARERAVIRPRAYYRGLRFAILRPSFANARSRYRRVPAQVRRILVGFGGTDPSGWTDAALKALAAMLPSTAHTEVLSGRALPHAPRGPRVTLHQAVADPAPLLRQCDLAIIGGGTMLMEAACLGLPAIVVPRTPDERVFARQFSRVGAARVVLSQGAFPARAVLRQVRRLLNDQEARADMHRAGRRLVDGRGSDRVARLIMNIGTAR